MKRIQVVNFEGTGKPRDVAKVPNECPFCHRHISPNVWGHAYGETSDLKFETIFLCANTDCLRLFIAYYSRESTSIPWSLVDVMKGTRKTTEFSDDIENVSPNFVNIFSQAEIAEQEKLSEICGVGYRKALEFLIKDYVIKKNTNDEEKIKKQLLGNTIKDYVTDDRIKTVAERAVWLGNDETHYVRKWEDKDVRDLKSLIHLTTLWIQMEIETERIKKEMPEPKK